jgi:hypothetical protein
MVPMEIRMEKEHFVKYQNSACMIWEDWMSGLQYIHVPYAT